MSDLRSTNYANSPSFATASAKSCPMSYFLRSSATPSFTSSRFSARLLSLTLMAVAGDSRTTRSQRMRLPGATMATWPRQMLRCPLNRRTPLARPTRTATCPSRSPLARDQRPPLVNNGSSQWQLLHERSRLSRILTRLASLTMCFPNLRRSSRTESR